MSYYVGVVFVNWLISPASPVLSLCTVLWCSGLFTDADKYKVDFLSEKLTLSDKLLLLSTVLFIDYLFFEGTDVSCRIVDFKSFSQCPHLCNHNNTPTDVFRGNDMSDKLLRLSTSNLVQALWTLLLWLRLSTQVRNAINTKTNQSQSVSHAKTRIAFFFCFQTASSTIQCNNIFIF